MPPSSPIASNAPSSTSDTQSQSTLPCRMQHQQRALSDAEGGSHLDADEPRLFLAERDLVRFGQRLDRRPLLARQPDVLPLVVTGRAPVGWLSDSACWLPQVMQM